MKQGAKGRTLSFEQIPIDLVLDFRSDIRLMIKTKDVVIDLISCHYNASGSEDEPEKPFHRKSRKIVPDSQ